MSTGQTQESIPGSCDAPLFRFLHMNDKSNTQVFTFILLPQLFCSELKEVFTSPFLYADHFWMVWFFKYETHLGVALELRTTEMRTGSNNSHGLHALGDRTVCIDFQFTIKSREHFARNILYKRTKCVFSGGKPKHGRKRLVELAALSSRRHIFDDGSCVVELEMRNAQVDLKLSAYPRKDPVMRDCENITLYEKSQAVMSLMRLDGTVVNFPESMHFETEKFFYIDSWWFFTVDMKPGYRDTLGSHKDSDCGNICVEVELSLVRSVETSRSQNEFERTIRKLQTDNHIIRCGLLLPGNYKTGTMEFEISPQGWPLKAYQFRFEQESSVREETGGKMNDVDIHMNTKDTIIKGSASELLLSTAKSSINIFCNFLRSERVTYKEVPASEELNESSLAYFVDPYKLPWFIQTKPTGRILRLQLYPGLSKVRPVTDDLKLGNKPCPSSVVVFGLVVQLLPATSRLREPVKSIGGEVLQLIRYEYQRPTSNYMGCEWLQITTTNNKVYEQNCQANRYEVAMDVSVEKAYDKNYGLLNPLKSTILVQLRWIYHQILQVGHIHPADEIDHRQLVQMRNELERLQTENDELERQLLAKQLGLVQISPRSHGPRSMVPMESVSAVHKQMEQSQWTSGGIYSGTCGVKSVVRPLFTSENECVQDYEHDKYSVHGKRCLDHRPVVKSNRRQGSVTGYRNYRQPVSSNFSDYDIQYGQSPLYEQVISDKDSVKSEYVHGRLPERRRQFTQSKSTWYTCEFGRDYSTELRELQHRHKASSSTALVSGQHPQYTIVEDESRPVTLVKSSRAIGHSSTDLNIYDHK